ncbi:uncharacterized protein A4U43_C04F16300 [Asparagus officinalis]|uniref:Glycosyl transferase CAP10 domain-containing protein n=1 Tax=Asparagus officinalis TaxID=4686 RepID=A0A5P1F5Z8_ASPOF|nr:uncharacterized protein A4U43_C04F16300 [Asparagus officinalis]
MAAAGIRGALPPAPPLFRYCTTKEHLDIPFPDWSFWGWPEINIKSWEEEFKSIKLGSQSMTWKQKEATAYWKGNPYTAPIRGTLLTCNDTKMWGAQIMRQDWGEEARAGFKKSELGNQCDHRYKIYAEGFACSVKACTISISFRFCFVKHRRSKLDMDRVYDYMYHLIVEYSKLQDFKPAPPPNAQEVCMESVLCLADDKQKQFLERSYASPATYVPCALSLP